MVFVGMDNATSKLVKYHSDGRSVISKLEVEKCFFRY